MKRLFTKSLGLVALVGGMMAFTTNSAEAKLVAYICNDMACTGGDDLAVEDNAAGDLNNTGNLVNISKNNFAGYEVTTNTTQRIDHGLDLTFTVTNSGGGVAGSIWLWAADKGFNGPLNLNGVIGGTLPRASAANPNSISAYICGGSDNVQPVDPSFGGACDSATASNNTNVGKVFGLDVNHAATGAPKYAYAIGINVANLANNTTLTGDFSVPGVPEPMTLSLLGLGLAGFAARRRRQQA